MTCRCAAVICRTGLALAVLSLTGCGTLPNGRGWGQDATWRPGLARVRRAAVGAALEPGTWAPAAGALVFSIDDFDERTSDLAVRHAPVFGSPSSAEDASSDLVDALQVWMVATALATPSGDTPRDWAFYKAKGLTVEQIAVELGALDLNKRTTKWFKTEIGRTRPDGSDNRSFPSGHTADAFGAATLAYRNLNHVPMPGKVRAGLQAATMTAAAGTAWARVEAERHYPSDVLAAAALGHFLTAFIHDAFLGLPEDGRTIEVVPAEDRVEVRVTWKF